MPHSAAKSQADKPRLTSSVQVSPPPTEDLEEGYIIPGRLTHTQWMDVLIQEDGEETVVEIMEELLSKVMEGCLKVYIEKQLAPYSTSWAKSYLTQILEQQSMCIDEGEDLKEASETEDSEPTPAPLDAWAQGCVPVNPTPPPQLASQQEANSGKVTLQSNQRVNQQCDVTTQTKNYSQKTKKETIARRPVSDKPSPRHVFSHYSPPKVLQKKKQQVNSPSSPVLGKLLPPLSGSAEKKDVEVKGKNRTHASGSSDQHTDYQHIQRDMPSLSKVLGCRSPPKVIKKITQQVNLPPKPVPGKLMPPMSCSAETKDVEVKDKNRTHTSGSSDQHNVYQHIPRLDHSCLPRHSIFPQYEILENDYTKPNSKKVWELSKLEPIHNKQKSNWTITSLKPLTSSKNQPARQRNEADVRLNKLPSSRHGEEEMVSSGRLRLDTVELARGVSLLDPQAVGMNSFKPNPPAQSAKLRPIRSDAALPLFSVVEVTSGPPPQVTTLFQSKKCDS